MQAYKVLGDPVRRRILELLVENEHAAGEIARTIQPEFGISQPAVSRHLKVLRENGFANVRADRTRRLYSLNAAPLRELDAWLEHFRGFWTHRLDALATEVARGKRARRSASSKRRPKKKG